MKKFLLFFILVLTACNVQSNKEVTVFSGIEMTINYRILVGGSLNPDEKNRISNLIQATFDEVNRIYNKWNPASELSQLNNLKAEISVSISKELEGLLKLTDQIVQLTDGRFDPTIEPLQKLWKNYLEQGYTPPLSEIQALIPAIGWNKIHFREGLFHKDHDSTCLDLGGIAKGYCVDLLVNRLNQAGFNNVFVEWGGEIRTSGEHPSRRPWTIFISRLGSTNPEEAIAILSLKNEAIATSGDYLQNWTVANEEGALISYFHVIDPFHYQPLKVDNDNVASASVLASSCAFADGLATAAMTFPSVQEARAWGERLRNQFPELSFWIESR